MHRTRFTASPAQAGACGRTAAPGPTGALITAYHDTGSRAYPLVLLHGFTGSKLDFHDQLEWFDDIARVIAPDQRGHGETSHAEPYSFDQLVDDLMGFLNAINVHRCTLLGHSMGGMVAMRAVLQHPDWFTSLILMDTSPQPFPVFPNEAVRTTIVDLVRSKGCQGLLDSMRGQPRTPAQQRGANFLGEAEHWRRIALKLNQMDPEAFAALSAEMSAQDLVASLPELNCPTTIIVGEHDTAFRAPAKLLAETLPRARLEVVAHAGHSPQYENPDDWKATVRQHLAAHGH